MLANDSIEECINKVVSITRFYIGEEVGIFYKFINNY